jgi:Zn-dependent protease with chaperone function
MLHQIRQYPQSRHGAYDFQLVDSPQPYSAQIGFWQPELVVSQGLFTHLAPEQVEAVLRHEQAHVHYRDTFWFFWLGWVRRCTAWLPQTEALWQELLLLREMRADRWAAQHGDPLTLAEALLEVIRAAIETSEWAVPFGATEQCRVTERIEAMLLSDPEPPQPARLWWLGWALLPLCLIPIHC